jgi:hypothetical protein
MIDHDAKRMKDRRDKLLSMIRKEFADDLIEEFDPENPGTYSGDSWMVSIERLKDRNRVVFKVTRPLMTNIDNAYEQIFEAGLKLAKRILEANSDEIDTNLGVVQLSSSGAQFYPPKKENHE